MFFSLCWPWLRGNQKESVCLRIFNKYPSEIKYSWTCTVVGRVVYEVYHTFPFPVFIPHVSCPHTKGDKAITRFVYEALSLNRVLSHFVYP